MPLPFRSATALLLFLLFGATALRAQDYRFRVERMDLQVFVQPDASIRMQYEIVFANQPGAHAIDVVDVGLPHPAYDIRTMTASLDDRAVTDIRKSEYIACGVEVRLGAHAIAAGRRGTFRFACVMPDMVYADTTDASRASLQIKPTWFDPDLQVDSTHLRMAVHLRPGLKPEEVKWQRDELRYQNLVQDAGDGHLVAIWEFPSQRLNDRNPKIGISFPQHGLQRVVRMTAVGLWVKWFSEQPEVQVVSGIALVILWLVLFFRFTSGTGVIVGLFLAAGLVVLMLISPAGHLICWPVMIALVACNEWLLRRRRKLEYLLATATVEGGGIKRGLTAPQAAVLLGLPLNQVLTLVVFGLLRKGFLLLVRQEPLTVEVSVDLSGSRRERQLRARKKGHVLHEYEQGFLECLTNWDRPLAECDFRKPLTNLVSTVVKRMQGFDLSDTQDYYRRIVAKAWQEAQAIGEIEQRTQAVDRHLDWLLLDDDWSRRFNTWGAGGYHYRPVWVRTARGASAASTSGGGGGAAASSRTSFGEVASSFVGWTENTTGKLVGAIDPSRLAPGLDKGVIDLTRVDTITSNVFDALASSGGSGGGGGGGCACACAGCACACACAGGGR